MNGRLREGLAREHAWVNGVQTALLIGLLFALGGGGGYLLLGASGFWIAAAAILVVLALEPIAVSRLTLAAYRARPLDPAEAPLVWRMLEVLADRAGLDRVPVPHYVPSLAVNAFAVGSRRVSAVALTDGLLSRLSARELAAVLAHEVAHIAAGDLRVMNLADYVSRLTGGLALLGLGVVMFFVPAIAAGDAEVEWAGLALLVASPYLANLAQLGLSRVREFGADLAAARLTGDPAALAAALLKVERSANAWRRWILPGWGDPDPSWLRSHPPTEQRVARLLALAEPLDPLDWDGGAATRRVRRVG